MRFWIRALLIVVLTVFGAVALFARAAVAWGALGTILGLVALAAASNGALFYWLRCGACGQWACRLPSGHPTVWPGFRCRGCGSEY